MSRFCSLCHNTDCINHGKPITLSGDNWSCNYIPTATNADRIRAMSDEELAKFLCDIREKGSCDSCEACVAPRYCHSGHNGFADWLQQPAQEE